MLATIDEDTERKLVADRRAHGVAYMRVRLDGRIEHVPYTRQMLQAEVEARLAGKVPQ